LTNTGPFAGVLEAFTTGVKFRTRYDHLLTSNTTSLWASDSERVINTAKYFSAGFFGLSWQDHAKLHVIPETSDLGADTLTPGDTCLQYNADLQKGHDYGANMLAQFRSTYLGAIGSRISKRNPGIQFTDAELYSMQEMCGFETTVRGSSLWCDVFSHEEWLSFEYARDIIHYYRAGPGNPYGPAMGWLWLNATTELLRYGPEAGPLFFSFVHDGDIVPMLAALDLFPDKEDLPVHGPIPKDRTWKTSQITPMGGRVVFERLACSASGQRGDKLHVRINVNDGIVPIRSCQNGPGSSCPLTEFEKLVKQRGQEIGVFQKICGLDPSAASRITFLHQ
jgi:acid phosphatase